MEHKWREMYRSDFDIDSTQWNITFISEYKIYLIAIIHNILTSHA